MFAWEAACKEKRLAFFPSIKSILGINNSSLPRAGLPPSSLLYLTLSFTPWGLRPCAHLPSGIYVLGDLWPRLSSNHLNPFRGWILYIMKEMVGWCWCVWKQWLIDRWLVCLIGQCCPNLRGRLLLQRMRWKLSVRVSFFRGLTCPEIANLTLWTVKLFRVWHEVLVTDSNENHGNNNSHQHFLNLYPVPGTVLNSFHTFHVHEHPKILTPLWPHFTIQGTEGRGDFLSQDHIATNKWQADRRWRSTGWLQT